MLVLNSVLFTIFVTKLYRQSDFMEIRGLRINPVADRIIKLFIAHGFVFKVLVL